MADVFSHADVLNLLQHKHVFFIGDSNIRAQYKDLICLLTANALATRTDLRVKCEPSFKGDRLIKGSLIHRGRDYKEVRQYFDEWNNVAVEFMFITRVYNQDLEDTFHDIKSGQKAVPDIIVISSSIWDLTRWGPDGVPKYKENLVKLMRLMTKSLPPTCLVIWAAATPPSRDIHSSFVIRQIQFMQPMMRFEIMEANWFTRETVAAYGYDVLDCHYYMRMQIHRRAKDGLHYLSIPVRFITNLLLTHIALSWDISLPGNNHSLLLQKSIELERETNSSSLDKQVKINIKKTKHISNILNPPVTPSPRGLQVTFNTKQDDQRKCNLYQENCNNFTNQLFDMVDPGRRLPTYWELPYKNHLPGPTRNTKKKRRQSKRNTSRGYPDYRSHRDRQ